ncbi:DUF58 domain-containing protein [Pseudenhygromyxa sp. WMMC2535]|uniref:DUF58 domain-containing protein n=1 Tax=Pseudenhygromyxa sp. WMMC2535 TaxID=2712867 RepID=UPI001557C5A4|nr:DUF58 domain-containing protein [Pseudenhygromyxa sp. WMMC2535]
MQDPVERLLPPAVRAALARRELLVRRPVAGGRHGVHRSLRPGVGRDFRDYRAYVPGDDPRRLDWRAAARSDRLVVRQTESQEELTITWLVDGSGGMGYGEGEARKWARAGTVVAALSSLALRQADGVGVVIGREGSVDAELIDASTRRDRLRALAGRFVGAEPAGACPWEAMLEAAAPRLRPRSLVLAVSDFLDPGAGQVASGEGERAADEALLRGLGLMRAAGSDVVLIQILHRDELSFPWEQPRVLRLEDPRGRRPLVEGPGASMRDAYLERLGAHLRWLEGSCERGGLLLVRLVSDGDPAGQLIDLLGRLAGAPSEVSLGEEGRA